MNKREECRVKVAFFFSQKKLQCFVCYWKRFSKEEEDDDTEERGEVLETKFLVSQRD